MCDLFFTNLRVRYFFPASYDKKRVKEREKELKGRKSEGKVSWGIDGMMGREREEDREKGVERKRG